MNLLKLFFGEKKKLNFPYHYGLVQVSEDAKKNGVFLDENKETTIFKGGKMISKSKYSEDEVKLLIAEGIPIVEIPIDDSEFNFIESADFGGVTVLR